MNLLADWEDADAEAEAANVAWVRALFAKVRPAMKRPAFT